jgi:hypothetical protein
MFKVPNTSESDTSEPWWLASCQYRYLGHYGMAVLIAFFAAGALLLAQVRSPS